MNLKRFCIIGSSIFLLILSCSLHSQNDYTHSQRVVVSGKVLHFSQDNMKIQLVVNRVALGSELIYADLDSVGNFKTSFESYVPTDVSVGFPKSFSFYILTHPGDSLDVVFDGSLPEGSEFWKAITFSGTSAKLNMEAAQFQYLYFSNELYTDWDRKERTSKEYTPDKYLAYLDTVRQAGYKLYDKFVATFSPSREAADWAVNWIEGEYYYYLSRYLIIHFFSPKISIKDLEIPVDYSNVYLKRLPISSSMYLCGSHLSTFINSFHFNYAIMHAIHEKRDTTNPRTMVNDSADTLLTFRMLKYVPDTSLRQMILAEHLSQMLDNYDIKLFETHREKIESIIHQPFLIEPLMKKYRETKERIKNPQIASDAFLRKFDNTSAKQIIDSILILNRGKVIYVDCWATWCGGCRAEMPETKKMMKEFAGKDIAFVFVCLDSEEQKWKSVLAELQIGGQHFLLTPTQSVEFRKAFSINGVPHHILIDQQGTIVENGTSTPEKILSLLNHKGDSGGGK